MLLTAAHCITEFNLKPEQIRAVAGKQNGDEGMDAQIRNVSEIVIHEGWNSRTFENDIAILLLGEPLHFDNDTRPVDIANHANVTEQNHWIWKHIRTLDRDGTK